MLDGIASHAERGAGTGMPWPVAAVALVAGLALVLPYALRVFGASINREVFGDLLRKLIAAGDPARALKLTRAAPRAPLACAMRAALTACRDGSAVAARENADYRRGGRDASPDAVLAHVRAAYDRGLADATRPIARARVLAAVGTASLLFATLAIELSPDLPLAVPILGALAVLFAANVARIERRLHLDGPRLFDGLADLFYPTALAPEAFGPPSVPPPRPTAAALPRLTLEIYEPERGRYAVECDQQIVKIGTLPTAHIQLASRGVARLHAVLERAADETTLIDLGAADGTRVNGHAVSKCALAQGDVISIGDAELRVHFPDSSGDGLRF